MPQITVNQAFQSAVQHHQAGRFPAAEQICRQILAQQPTHVGSLHLLGILAAQVGKHDEAVAFYLQATQLEPKSADLQVGLGASQIARGNLDVAIKSLRRAVELKPDSAIHLCNLGGALIATRNLDEAIAVLRRSLEINPNHTNAHQSLAIALGAKGFCDEAIAILRQAIQINPTEPYLHSGLAIALTESGRIDDAVAAFREAVSLNPNNAQLHSNLVYSVLFHPGSDAQKNFEESRQWAERHEQPLSSKRPASYANDRSPDRRIRVGYVSPDFRLHPVGRFLLPLLAAHDHQKFEIFCYSSVQFPNDRTSIFQSHADVWRNILSLSDDAAAELIRSDGIDILVDLSMHMDGNRLTLFARKPAPVQVTYLAYAGTTGLDSIDYRITDPYLDPPGSPQEFYSEKSVHLPTSYWCYEPPVNDLETASAPYITAGHITFGCLNNFWKVSPAALDTWMKILAAIPTSRLILHTSIGEHRDRIRQAFSTHGIQPDRLTFTERLPLREYLQQYNNIDIALDPFPYVGGTTTCDALWMGVPTITLRGQSAISRGGVSILSNIGHPELIADTPEQYIQLAIGLANDPSRLSNLRSTLRKQMIASPLMDANRFARDMESAYREIWQKWCAKNG